MPLWEATKARAEGTGGAALVAQGAVGAVTLRPSAKRRSAPGAPP